MSNREYDVIASQDGLKYLEVVGESGNVIDSYLFERGLAEKVYLDELDRKLEEKLEKRERLKTSSFDYSIFERILEKYGRNGLDINNVNEQRKILKEGGLKRLIVGKNSLGRVKTQEIDKVEDRFIHEVYLDRKNTFIKNYFD